MPLKFCANLTTLYSEYSFLDRFKAAQSDGFTAVECQFPYEFNPLQLKNLLTQYQLTLVLLNAPAGEWTKGMRGLASDPNHTKEFRERFKAQAVPYALELGSSFIHVMAGILPNTNNIEIHRTCYLNNLHWASQWIQNTPLTILIEALNPWDVPHYFLNHPQQAFAIAKELSLPNIGVQLDFYHCGRLSIDPIPYFHNPTLAPWIKHVQIASIPHRHEPNPEQYDIWLPELEKSSYQGYIGCEYTPAGNTHLGLNWIKKWLSPPTH
jgi:hydroxypyruvate isomerase